MYFIKVEFFQNHPFRLLVVAYFSCSRVQDRCIFHVNMGLSDSYGNIARFIKDSLLSYFILTKYVKIYNGRLFQYSFKSQNTDLDVNVRVLSGKVPAG